MNSNSTNQPSIILVGASFNTGNLGVSALAWSSIKIILNRWPDAKISLIGTDKESSSIYINFSGKNIPFQILSTRYCINILIKNHFFHSFFVIILCAILPFLRRFFHNQTTLHGSLLHCDLICDITGGDSFSDIYGIPRFIRSYLLKLTCQYVGKPFILLPQTYGPFRSKSSQVLARHILKKCARIYSRDLEGLNIVKYLIGDTHKLKYCPDVALVLDTAKPKQTILLKKINKIRSNKRIIGINISGLLYYGGVPENNIFKLISDYRQLLKEIFKHFSQKQNHHILLIYHTIPPSMYLFDNDLLAAKNFISSLHTTDVMNITSTEDNYNQNEIKYLIGLCDFFIGSRMHATIAAFSQNIPTIGLAYSDKFAGVFETAGIGDCVIDLRYHSTEAVLDKIEIIYNQSDKIRSALELTIPKLKSEVFKLLDGIEILN